MSSVEQLSAEEQANLKKMSSERILMILSRAGGDIDVLSQASREELLEQMADHLLQGQQAAASDDDLDKSSLSERHIILLERQLQLQQEHAERQFRLQQEQVERQFQLQQEQADRQFRLQEQQIQLDRDKHALERERQGSLAARVKYYGDALKYSTVRMTDEPGDLPHFFTSLENVFDTYEVPTDLRAKLTIPLLTSKAKTLLSRLPVEKLAKYADLRKFLLSEFHLTSEQYRDRFINIKRKPDETFTLFCSRLRSLFRYYLDSRNVGQNFDKLVSLMIADRLKTEMSASCLKHILTIETASEWLGCDKVADAADIFMNNHFADGQPRMMANKGDAKTSAEARSWSGGVSAEARPDTGRSSIGSGARGKTCFQCGSPDHLASFHRRSAAGAGSGGRGDVRPLLRPPPHPENLVQHA